MLKIKLKPTGKIHQRSFRIVVASDRSKANGKFIDDLGFYTPTTKTLQIDKKKMTEWQKNGAKITIGVDKLLNPDKYPRKKKIKKEEEKIEKKQNPSPLDKGDIKTEEVKEVKEEIIEEVK